MTPGVQNRLSDLAAERGERRLTRKLRGHLLAGRARLQASLARLLGTSVAGRPQNSTKEKKRRRAVRRFAESGEAERLAALKDIHAGERCFILGNGPSLKTQDLSLLKDEVVFVTNWFANHDRYHELEPNYYCICSHEMFGGWNKPRPAFNPQARELLNTRAKEATKFFSFAFKEYIEREQVFPDQNIYYLLFERPKYGIDEVNEICLDLAQPMNDGYTVIITFCLPLALHMGFKEIYLLGCDCDYGISKPSDPKNYFYDAQLHTSKTSKFESLQRIWADGGPIFQVYEIVRRTFDARGVAIINATAGGRLEVFPRANYESLMATKVGSEGLNV